MKLAALSVALAVVTAACAHASPQASPATQSYTKVTRYTGIAPPPGPLADELPGLEARYAEGDMHAASEIYAGFAKCRALRTHGPAASATSYCNGVIDGDIAGAGAWLATAAEAGDADAMYTYAIAGGDELQKSGVAANSKLAKLDFASRARDYLNELASKCNVDAVNATYQQKLSGGSVFEQDLYGAYTLQTELVDLYPGLISQDQRDSLANKLSPDERARSISAAASFLTSHCR